MVRQLTYAIVADGGTDRVLQPVIEHALRRLDQDVEILEPEFNKRRAKLQDFLAGYPEGPMLVFAHRDAEAVTLEERKREFEPVDDPRVVPVIPVRMTEAWLLVDARAICKAAGRPEAVVEVPPPGALERMADPKQHLEQLLLTAAGEPTGRRRRRFTRDMVTHRVNVAAYVRDFSALHQLTAYRSFESDLARAYPYG